MGSARLTCGQHPEHRAFPQINAKREYLTCDFMGLDGLLVDRFVNRMSFFAVPS